MMLIRMLSFVVCEVIATCIQTVQQRRSMRAKRSNSAFASININHIAIACYCFMLQMIILAKIKYPMATV